MKVIGRLRLCEFEVLAQRACQLGHGFRCPKSSIFCELELGNTFVTSQRRLLEQRAGEVLSFGALQGLVLALARDAYVPFYLFYSLRQILENSWVSESAAYLSCYI